MMNDLGIHVTQVIEGDVSNVAQIAGLSQFKSRKRVKVVETKWLTVILEDDEGETFMAKIAVPLEKVEQIATAVDDGNPPVFKVHSVDPLRQRS